MIIRKPLAADVNFRFIVPRCRFLSIFICGWRILSVALLYRLGSCRRRGSVPFCRLVYHGLNCGDCPIQIWSAAVEHFLTMSGLLRAHPYVSQVSLSDLVVAQLQKKTGVTPLMTAPVGSREFIFICLSTFCWQWRLSNTIEVKIQWAITSVDLKLVWSHSYFGRWVYLLPAVSPLLECNHLLYDAQDPASEIDATWEGCHALDKNGHLCCDIGTRKVLASCLSRSCAGFAEGSRIRRFLVTIPARYRWSWYRLGIAVS